MIVDDNVQKTRGFSPQMAQFLVNDANKIMQSNNNNPQQLILSGPFTQEESAARAKREADLYWK